MLQSRPVNNSHPANISQQQWIQSHHLATKDKSQIEITTYKSDIVPVEGNKMKKYLAMPKVPEKQKSKKQTGARIVTSHEFIAELQEKEK